MALLLGDKPLTRAEINARYDGRNRKKRAADARARYAADPKHVYAIVRKCVAKNPLMRLLQVARKRAKESGPQFEIVADALLPLPTHCPVFGTRLRYGGKGFDPNAASIDRLDSTLGYVRGNVAIISRRANMIKNDGTAAEHRAIANWMENGHGIS